MKRTQIFDIETSYVEEFSRLEFRENPKVHCMCILDIKEGQKPELCTFKNSEMREGLKLLAEADILVGHNIISFDIPALKKLHKFKTKAKLHDTKIIAGCVFSDIMTMDAVQRRIPKNVWGSNSLKSWGYRLGFLKGEYGEETENAWDQYSEEMAEYCRQDVRLTYKLYRYLMKKKPAERMLDLEEQFARIIRQQELRGWVFNKEKCRKLIAELSVDQTRIREELEELVPPRVEYLKSPAKFVLIKDGNIFEGKTKKEVGEQLAKYGYPKSWSKDAEGKGRRKKLHYFNPGSRDQIAEYLHSLGWIHTEETDGGKPRIDESTLEPIKEEYEVVPDLLRYLLVSKRISQAETGQNGWIKCEHNGRIHGKVNTTGTMTGRCTHASPNLAQVPRVGNPYGKECRELFEARPGWKLVGCDASGLELRCLAHYMGKWDNGEYAKVILEGDIHTENQLAAGLETRDQAKTFIYAFLYGAGDEKIGSIVGGDKKDGRALKAKFFKSLPALKKLKDAVDNAVERKKSLTGLDGRILPIRSKHAALNVLLQSAGAVVMKQALINTYAKVRKHLRLNVDYAFVGNIHDEFQTEIKPKYAVKFGKAAVQGIQKSGEDFNFRCPLDGEYKIGTNWAMTH